MDFIGPNNPIISSLLLIYFAAVIKLRYSHAHVKRSYTIPAGKLGVWIVSGVGILTSCAVFFFSFLPPPGIKIGNLYVFESFLVIGLVIFCGLPWLIMKIQKNYLSIMVV